MKMLKVNDLIGVKFVNHGRSVEQGFDCYGLAIEVSKRLGHELPDLWYEKSSPETFAKNVDDIINKMGETVKKTDTQMLGNLIIFSDSFGNMVHIGVLLEEGFFIHSDIGGVKVSNLETYYRKIWEVYEWQH